MTAPPPSFSTPVLIVGGGLVGLSAALFLSERCVACVLVERHAGSSAHPRAVGYTPRTMEVFASSGLAAAIPASPPDFRLRRVKVQSLAGKWGEESSWTPPAQAADTSARSVREELSPWKGAAIAQDALEPLIRSRAVELGADIRLSTECLSFQQDDDGVTAALRTREGAQYSIRAQYLIAADGHRSAVREALGIGRSGRGLMRVTRSVLFRAPLAEYLQSGVSQFEVSRQLGAEVDCFLTTYHDGRWVLIFEDDEQRDEEAQRALIHAAIGRSDLGVDILASGRWELSALVADRFSVGRVFLAGDAAHTLPPNRGGYGANTGIDDAHNLAWKLQAVLSRQSSPQLLDSYTAERQPIARLRHDQIFARPDYRRERLPAAQQEAVQALDDEAMEFGQLYRSSAVIFPAGVQPAALPAARRPEDWAGFPGTRAPHLRLRRAGRPLSTLDLFGSFALLTADARWRAAASKALQVVVIGQDVDVDGPGGVAEWSALYGLKEGGATLVRPDGYIAWRSVAAAADAAQAAADALATASCALRDCP